MWLPLTPITHRHAVARTEAAEDKDASSTEGTATLSRGWLSRAMQGVTVLVVLACVCIVGPGSASHPPEELNLCRGSDTVSPLLPGDLLMHLLSPRPTTPQVISPEIRSYVHQLLSAALHDPVARRDYALHADGATVIHDLTLPMTRDADVSPDHTTTSSHSAPEVALTDNLRIGQCWHVRGQTCQLAVGVPAFLHPTHITIDHIPIEISADIRQAPHRMLLWGLVEGPHNRAHYHALVANGVALHSVVYGRYGPSLSKDHLYVLLATFKYDIYAPFHIQTFTVDKTIIDSDFYFGVIVLEVVDNWGADSTCLYRVRLHGHEVVM